MPSTGSGPSDAQQVGQVVGVAGAPARGRGAAARPRCGRSARRRAGRAGSARRRCRAARRAGRGRGSARPRAARPAASRPRRGTAPRSRTAATARTATGDGVSTSTTCTSREPMSRIRSTSPGTSKTSWTHSRTASSTIGKVGYWLATSSSCEARCRCCHSGWRRSGRRRGSSSARAGALAEPRGEQRRAADLLGDQAAHVVGVEGDQVEQLAADPALAHALEVVELDVGQAQHDAVVAVHRLHVDAEPLAHPGARRPAPTARAPGRRTASGRRPASRRARRGTARRRSRGRRARARWPRAARAGRRAGCRTPSRRARRASTRSRAASASSASTSRTNAPTAAAQLGRAARASRPSRTAAARARPGAGVTSTWSWVMSSMRQVRGAEGDHVADPRLVDHLLVELADPASGPLAGRGTRRTARGRGSCRPR